MGLTDDRIRAAEERARRRLSQPGDAGGGESEGAAPPPVSRGFDELRSRLRDLRDQLGEGARSSSARPEVTPSRVRASAETISAAGRVYLERALSELKHGVVESCFYNLRLLSQQLAAEPGDAGILARLHRAGARLDEVDGEVREFLDGRVPEGLRVGDLLPEVEQSFRIAVPRLRLALGDAERQARAVPPLVDSALEGMTRAARRLRELRVSLVDVLRQVMEVEGPRLEECGLSVDVAVETEDDRIQADPPRMRRAVVELLRNASVHRLGTAPGEVRITVEDASGQLVLRVANRPAEPPRHDPERLLEPGVGRRSEGGDGLAGVRGVAQEHGGALTVEYNEPGREFVVRLGLPRRTPS